PRALMAGTLLTGWPRTDLAGYKSAHWRNGPGRRDVKSYSLRSYNGLSPDLYKPSDYDRLALSLLSPLPNEQDFAINVCTLLSNEGKHTLKLDKYPRLIDFLLAHAGVFNHSNKEELFEDVYGKVRKHSLRHFWIDALADQDLSELVDETLFPTKKPKVKEVICEVGVLDPKEKTECKSKLKVPLKLEHSDLDLFCLGRSFGTQDYVGQRVMQVATILRNLSFGEENVGALAKNVPFLRFLLLCAGSRWNCLHQMGLDMLGNVASEVLLEDPTSDRLSANFLSTVTRGLHSQDRMVVLSCLEVLNKLSQKDENEDIMLRYLDQRVYNQVCTFLTLHDIMLLIYTLECLYSLSSLGERACNCIVRVHGAIDTLVSLITVEAQSYGPKACILMRVVETVSGTQAGSTTTTTTTTTAMTSSASPAQAVTPVRTPVVAPPRQTTPQRIVIGAPQPAVATPVTLTMAQSPQQYQQQQHAHQQAAQENEQFALAWLRATYEPASGCRIEQGELYKQYLTACAKIGRRGVIAPLHFPRCVRSVFGGTVGPNQQKQQIVIGTSSSGTEQHGTTSVMFYEGIKVRATPYSIPVSAASPMIQQQPPSPQQTQQRKSLNVVTPPPPTTSPAPAPEGTPADATSLPVAPAPASPILKAQLSAPPKPRESPKGDVKSQVVEYDELFFCYCLVVCCDCATVKVLAHPHLTQALLGSSSGGSPSSGKALPAGGSNKEAAGGPPTSLIKSLLATKVNAGGSECMMTQPAVPTSMLPAECSTTTTTTTKQPPPTPQIVTSQGHGSIITTV
ncbi:hypothetical protein L9F63_007605, partial [Diploptera punctata]